jgi:hypothetical protein
MLRGQYLLSESQRGLAFVASSMHDPSKMDKSSREERNAQLTLCAPKGR